MRNVQVTLLGGLALAMVIAGTRQFSSAAPLPPPVSDNQDKIVGRWVNSSPLPGEANVADVKVTLEITADGKFSLNTTIRASAAQYAVKGTYRLGKGDVVNFENLDPPGMKGNTDCTMHISIRGDEMTWKDDDGRKLTLARVKDANRTP